MVLSFYLLVELLQARLAPDEGSTSRAASYVGLVWGDNTVTWGAGTDTDIIVAGIKALVSAINNK